MVVKSSSPSTSQLSKIGSGTRQQEQVASKVKQIFLSGDIAGAKEYARQNYKGYSGGGTVTNVTNVTRSISPEEQAARVLEQKRTEVVNQQKDLQSKAQTVSKQLDAYNKIQNALNRGTVINPEWIKDAGLSNNFVNQAILSKKRTELQNQLTGLQKEEVNINKKASQYNLARATVISDLEQPIGTSKLKVGASPSQYANVILQTNKTEQIGTSSITKDSTGNLVGDFTQASGEAVFGVQPNTGKTLSGQGGLYQRTQEAYFGTVKGTREFGKEVGKKVAGETGGQIGEVGGGLVGGALGTILGAFETPATIGKVAGGTIERQFKNKTLGEVTEFGVNIVGLSPRAGTTVVKAGVKGGAKAIQSTPALLEGLGLARQGEKAETIISAARTGFNTERVIGSSIYAGKTEKVASAVGVVTKKGSNLLSNRGFTSPLFVGGSLVLPEATEQVSRLGISNESLSKINPQAQAKGYELIAQQQKAQGFVAEVGGQLGLGAFKDFQTLGGRTTKQVEESFKQAYIEQGYSSSDAKKIAKTEAKLYKSRQTGTIGGLVSLSTGTELLGSSFITPIVEKSVLKAGVQTTTKSALKVGGQTALRTIPAFASLGLLEGFTGTGISRIGQRKTGVSGLGQDIVSNPLEYAIGGATGFISAPALGTPIIGLGVARTVQPTSKAFTRRIASKGTELLGYSLDPYESPGDYFATFFGKKEPAFKITQKIRSGGESIFQLTAGQDTSLIGGKAKTSLFENVFTKNKQTTGTNIFQPTENIGSNVNIGQPIGTTTSTNTNIFGEVFNFNNQSNIATETNITEEVAIPTSVFINVPVSTPISRAGTPFPFGVGGFGEGAGGKGKGRKKVKYINELAIAASEFARTNTQITPLSFNLTKKEGGNKI